MREFPAEGRSREAILEDLRQMAAGDADWRQGRVPLFVFKASEEAFELGRDAFMAFFSENALGAKRAFGSLGRMECQVVEMALDLFHAPEGAVGNMTSGGTESIVMAVKACRDFERARRGLPRHRGNLVLAESAHPAFDKAGRMMDIEVRRVPTGPDLRADVDAMEGALDVDTIMLVGSAPCFPHGVIDPIEELGDLALRRDLWLHVDACVGGYLAPFVAELGHPVPAFDLAVPGVASLSADLHKYGFCPKPASTVFYRDGEHAAHQGFDLDVWPSGRFVTQTLVGTRPGGAVAGAWATLQGFGRRGYRENAARIMAMVGAYRQGIEAIAGLEVWGDPHLAIVTFGSRELDIFKVAEAMAEKGWVPGLVRKPKAMHLMLSMLHEPAREPWLADLAACVAAVREGTGEAARITATY